MKVSKPTVLTALSITGVAATTVVTAYMSPKADRAIKARKREIEHPYDGKLIEAPTGTTVNPEIFKPKKLTTADKLELVKTAAPYYIPTAIGLIATITCILLNHKEYKKGLIAASAASAYLAANRNKIKAALEKPEVKKIIGKILPTKEEFKHQTIEETGNGDLLCIEGYSGRIFRSSREVVEEAQKQLSEQYIEDKYCCYNDYYRNLNILETQFGYDHGWANNEDWYYKNEKIEFRNEIIPSDAEGNEFGEDILCIDLEPEWYPMECWMEV